MTRIWMADYPPDSPSAYDDEFADASFNTGLWAEWDAPSKLTVSEGAYGLSLLQATASGHNLTGVYQAVPAGDWAIWTRAALSSASASGQYAYVGLILGKEIAAQPTTSDAITLHITREAGGAAMYVQTQLWTAYNAASTQYQTFNDIFVSTYIYLRIRRATTTYFFDISLDGIGWHQVYTTASLAFTPAEMGLFVNNNNNGADLRGIFSFFRLLAGTPALTTVMPGKRVM